jgi:hypothetical protein
LSDNFFSTGNDGAIVHRVPLLLNDATNDKYEERLMNYARYFCRKKTVSM